MSLVGAVREGIARALEARPELACPQCRCPRVDSAPHLLTHTDGHRCRGCWHTWTTPQAMGLSARLFGARGDTTRLRQGARRLPGRARGGW